MSTRNGIALALCAAALVWPCADRARADEGTTGTDPGGKAQATATAAQAQPVDTVDMKVVDELPQIVKRVAPVYPRAARKRGEQGTVFVRALVGRDGKPVQVAVASGKGVWAGLDKAAVDAVKQWTFTPAKMKGKPVAVWVVIPVKFKLA